MKTRCPGCGCCNSLDALIAHEDARRAVLAAFGLSGEIGMAVIRYLGLFRPENRELTFERVAKLIGEIAPDMNARRISRNGKVYEAPLEAWLWGIEQALLSRADGRLKTPLKTHGWLYEVMSGYKSPPSPLLQRGGSEAGGFTTNKAASRTLAGIAALEQFKNG